jgi:hypothetical protein
MRAGCEIVIIDKVRLDRVKRQRNDTGLKDIARATQRLRDIAGASVLTRWIELEARKAGAEIRLHERSATPEPPDSEICRAMLAAWQASAAVAPQ